MDKYISFDFVREQLKDSYSAVGRLSIDPELATHLADCFFLVYASPVNASWWKSFACIWPGAGSRGWCFDQEIPHHSRFSKNRHERFEESKIFEQLLEFAKEFRSRSKARILAR